MMHRLEKLAAAAMLSLAAAGAAAAYPEKPVTVIVATAAGGTADMVARMVTQHFSDRFGRQFVVENKPGAGNVIGTAAAAKAPADGYTIFLGTSSSLTVNPAIYPNLQYDPIRDFAPVSLLAFSRIVIVAHPSVPVGNLKEMVDHVRAKPGQYTYATPGNGTTHHLAGEMLKSMTGMDMTAVPYKGSVPALTDVLAGRVPFMFDNVNTAMVQVKAGKLKALAVTSKDRASGAPDVPTAAEAGFRGYDISGWVGLLVPAGTSKEIVQLLHAACVDMIRNPEAAKRLAAGGLDAVGGTPEAFTQQMKTELDAYRAVIRKANIRIE